MKPTPAPRAPVHKQTPTADEHREEHLSRLVAAAQAGDEAALRDVIAWAMDYLLPAVLSMLYERHAQGDYVTETLHRGGADFAERLRDDAWAVTHAACCRIAQRIDTFRGRNAFGRRVQFATWAYAVAQNELRTMLRTRRRERKRYGGSVDEWANPGANFGSDGRRYGGTVRGTARETTRRTPRGAAFGSVSQSDGTSDGAGANAAVDLRNYPVESSPEHAALSNIEAALVREALRNAPLTPEQREAVVLFHGYGYRQEQIAAMTGVQVGTVKKRVFDGLRKLRAYVESRQAGPEQDRSPAPPKRQGRDGR